MTNLNIFSCIASYNPSRIVDMLRNIAYCYNKGTTLILLTGESDLFINPVDPDYILTLPIIKKIEGKSRIYGEVMLEKVEFCKQYCNDDSIVFMLDDDYATNPWAFKVAKKVFEENEEVNYLSLLKGVGLMPREDEIINLSGFDFVKIFSCMGGSLIVRWKVFKEHFEEFVSIHGTEHFFDYVFFEFLHNKLGTDKLVYTLWNFSLMQHCNCISHYLEHKGELGTRAHSYGDSAEMRGNPFLIVGAEEIKNENT